MIPERQINGFSSVEVITIMAIIAVIIGLLYPVLTGEKKVTQTTEERRESTANYLSREVYTVAYEGHKFVVFNGYRQGGITHHPDCACQRKGAN